RCPPAKGTALLSRRCIEPIHPEDTSPRYIEQLTSSPSRSDQSEKSRSLALMWSQRRVVDYGLAKRAVVHAVRAGRTSPRDACDAQPYLLRAARHFGEPTDRLCPMCERRNVTNVTYVYGDSLGRHAGQAKGTSEL